MRFRFAENPAFFHYPITASVPVKLVAARYISRIFLQDQVQLEFESSLQTAMCSRTSTVLY